MDNNFQIPGSPDWRNGKTTAQCNRYMLENQLHCDIEFIVGEEKARIPAHKYILISRSEVFEAMITGLMHEHSDVIAIPDITPSAFRKLLEFMYFDNTRLEEHEACDILYAARKYLVMDLVHRCLQRLKTKMSVENVCLILSYADDQGTVNLCLKFIYRYPSEVLKSEGFFQLTADNINLIIRSSRLAVSEEEIFNSLLKWSEQECLRRELEVLPENQYKVMGEILNYVRFGRMNPEYLFSVCKKYLPIEIYTDIVENIAFRPEVRDVDEHSSNSPVAGAQSLHSNTACASEVSRETNLMPYGISSLVLDGSIEPDCVSDDTSEKSSWRDKFTVYRFGKDSHARGKIYSGFPDTISFLTSKDVELVAILLYGSCESAGTYEIQLEICQDLSGNLSQIYSSDHELRTNGFRTTYELCLTQAVPIEKDRVYTLRALIHGPTSYFGTNGKAEVRRNGVQVLFLTNEDDFGMNLTTTEGGQFPGLVFEKPT